MMDGNVGEFEGVYNEEEDTLTGDLKIRHPVPFELRE